MSKPTKPTTSSQIFIDNSKGLQPVSSGTPMPKVKPAQPMAQTQQPTTTGKKGR